MTLLDGQYFNPWFPGGALSMPQPIYDGHVDYPDYLFALLCGYGRDPPAGMTLLDGQYFNPWFPGGALSMPQPIYDGHVDYADGTPATIPQMAKDISEFLAWCG